MAPKTGHVTHTPSSREKRRLLTPSHILSLSLTRSPSLSHSLSLTPSLSHGESFSWLRGSESSPKAAPLHSRRRDVGARGILDGKMIFRMVIFIDESDPYPAPMHSWRGCRSSTRSRSALSRTRDSSYLPEFALRPVCLCLCHTTSLFLTHCFSLSLSLSLCLCL